MTPMKSGPRWLGGWVALCAAAEAIGMTASAGAARAADALPASTSIAVGLALIVAGGIIEGLAVGVFQAIGLRRRMPGLKPRRWILATLLVAGVGWTAASAPAVLASGADDDSAPPLALVLLGALALGAAMGALMGAAQAPGLRGLVAHPWRWVGVSTLAWAPTMVIIFIGATTPDATWTLPSVILLGTVTGALAGTALGLVSGVLLVRVEP